MAKTQVVTTTKTLSDPATLVIELADRLGGYWPVDISAMAPAGMEVTGGGWEAVSSDGLPVPIRFQRNGPIVADDGKGGKMATGWRFVGRIYAPVQVSSQVVRQPNRPELIDLGRAAAPSLGTITVKVHAVCQ